MDMRLEERTGFILGLFCSLLGVLSTVPGIQKCSKSNCQT